MNTLPLILPPLIAQAAEFGGGAELGFSVLGIVLLLLGLVGFAVWLWSLIHCIKNRHLNDTNRVIGIVLIVLLGLIGSLVYLFLPREPEPQR